jgi:hypothetical protein
MDFEGHPDLYRSLIINADFDIIIDMLIAKPELDVIICELMPEILVFNGFSEKQISLIDDMGLNMIQKFVGKLILLDKFNIIKKIIDITTNNGAYVYWNLYTIFKDSKILNKFYDMAPMFIFEHINIFLDYIHGEIVPCNRNVYSYVEALKFAIKYEFNDMLKKFLHLAKFYALVQDFHSHKKLIIVAYSVILKKDTNYFNKELCSFMISSLQFGDFLKILPLNYNFDLIINTVKTLCIGDDELSTIIHTYAKNELNKYAADTNNNDLRIIIENL